MSAVNLVTSWAERLATRTFEQFKDKPNLTAIAYDVLAPQLDELEAMFHDLASIASIDDSDGIQLDVIGRLVGETRDGASDTDYRPRLRAKIAANVSGGAVEDLYRVLRALLGSTVPLEFTLDTSSKGFVISIDDTITATEAEVAMAMLTIAKDAGARCWLEWRESAAADCFTWCDVGGEATGKGFGDATDPAVGGVLAAAISST